MYYYLHGLITLHNKDNVVIECQGIGYNFLCTNIDDFPIGEIMIVYVYRYKTDDDDFFVGFKTLDEKNLFSSLVSVKGIGIRTALNIMSKEKYMDIQEAIKVGNHLFFEKIPNIGKKSAFQIILDLKGKLKDDSLNINNEKETDNKKTARLALKKLGYGDHQINKAYEQIKDDLNYSVQDYIKKALEYFKNESK